MAFESKGSVNMSGFRGDRGLDPLPPNNHKAIGFISNAGPDPLKSQKAIKPAFIVGP